MDSLIIYFYFCGGNGRSMKGKGRGEEADPVGLTYAQESQWLVGGRSLPFRTPRLVPEVC